MEIRLDGGVANAGTVVRSGDHVLRPSNPHTPSIHRFLDFIDQAGFDGASQPVGVDPDGRERLRFIEGDVAVPPYPGWARTDAALGSIARLMRRFHDAAATFVPRPDDSWSADERADLLTALGETIARGGEFLLRRVEAGDENFIQMWTSMGGMSRFDRRRAWWADNRRQFEAAMR